MSKYEGIDKDVLVAMWSDAVARLNSGDSGTVRRQVQVELTELAEAIRAEPVSEPVVVPVDEQPELENWEVAE